MLFSTIMQTCMQIFDALSKLVFIVKFSGQQFLHEIRLIPYYRGFTFVCRLSANGDINGIRINQSAGINNSKQRYKWFLLQLACY